VTRAGIHPGAWVDPCAELGAGVTIGPGAVIGPYVRIGAGTKVDSHALVTGWTRIGRDCHLHHGAAVGGPPQDLKYSGDAPSYLAPAEQLAEHARFENAHGDKEYLRTPGYPLFVAAVYRVFGERNTAVLLVQVLLSALTVYLAYLLASWMWSAGSTRPIPRVILPTGSSTTPGPRPTRAAASIWMPWRC